MENGKWKMENELVSHGRHTGTDRLMTEFIIPRGLLAWGSRALLVTDLLVSPKFYQERLLTLGLCRQHAP